ncbi:hypothetical protein MRS44_005278 [Fusarium solani]|uniref:uncharacterized protein n=1 Tax=Fusarium solani TaxID=169388 RepID=UPI0032C45816|nr:hypothetical protein MRS44_005278 [Fusarium solani]
MSGFISRLAFWLMALQVMELLPSAAAEFRVTCAPFKRERIDPLASPGRESDHMHTFWGSRAIGPNVTTSDELRSLCGTCTLKADRSEYWIPTLYYVSKKGTVPVRVSIFHVYYHGQHEGMEPFPEDFSIITGNPNLTEEEARQQGGIGMKWHWELTEEENEDWELPKKKGSGRLRGNIGFPTRVVRDPSLDRHRACKSDDEEGCFSVVRMLFAIWYDMRHDWFDFEDGGYLTLSSGGGHTYHADFVYGWDKSMAKQIVTDTTNYNAEGKIIGGPDAVVKSPECAKLDDEDPFLWDSDWDAMLQANAGNDTVVLGHYNRGLTITDGKSVNATWSGKWGERPRVVKEPLTYHNVTRANLHANETTSSHPTPRETTASIPRVNNHKASDTNCARRHMKKRPKHL